MLACHIGGFVGLRRRGRMCGGTGARPWYAVRRNPRRAGEPRSRDPAGAGARAVMALDLRLYALIDPEHAAGHHLVELAQLLAQGGATLVQLRDKRSPTRLLVEQAREIKAALAGFAVPFLINDRVDVALACGADGVHVGQEDMAVADARGLMGPGAIIGLSIKMPAEAEAAPLDLLNYVGVGGVFATSSSYLAAPIGVAGLTRIAGIVRRRARGFPVRHCGHHD